MSGRTVDGFNAGSSRTGAAGHQRFPVTRIVSTSDGGSAFVDDALQLTAAGEIGLLGEAVPARDIVLRMNPPDYDYDWHCAPDRQFILMLSGEIEIEVTDGERRRFHPGDVVFLEDTSGRGHRTRNTGLTWRNSAFVRVTGDVPFLGGPATD